MPTSATTSGPRWRPASSRSKTRAGCAATSSAPSRWPSSPTTPPNAAPGSPSSSSAPDRPGSSSPARSRPSRTASCPATFATSPTREARVILMDAGPTILPRFPSRCAAGPPAICGRWASRSARSTLAVEIDVGGMTVRAATQRRRDGSHDERLRRARSSGRPGCGRRRRPTPWRRPPPPPATASAACWLAPDLSLPGHPEVFAIGDMVAGRRPARRGAGRHAGGPFVASLIEARVTGRPLTAAFRYHDKGTMATVGPRRAIVDAYGLRVGGLAGSVMWAFIHLYYLIGWGNRWVTLLRWLLQMTTRNRSNRLVDVEHAASWRELRRRGEATEPGFWEKMRRKDGAALERSAGGARRRLRRRRRLPRSPPRSAPPGARCGCRRRASPAADRGAARRRAGASSNPGTHTTSPRASPATIARAQSSELMSGGMPGARRRAAASRGTRSRPCPAGRPWPARRCPRARRPATG